VRESPIFIVTARTSAHSPSWSFPTCVSGLWVQLNRAACHRHQAAAHCGVAITAINRVNWFRDSYRFEEARERTEQRSPPAPRRQGCASLYQPRPALRFLPIASASRQFRLLNCADAVRLRPIGSCAGLSCQPNAQHRQYRIRSKPLSPPATIAKSPRCRILAAVEWAGQI
jgi:hypothetical protein